MERKNFKKLARYYAPHKKLFWANMCFAVLGAAIAVAVPLLVRYLANTVVSWSDAQALPVIGKIAAVLLGMLLLEMYCNYFVTYYGHLMGAKIEYRMRNELFTRSSPSRFTTTRRSARSCPA